MDQRTPGKKPQTSLEKNFLLRMHHMGCPVLYGNKWIGNKWIRWEAQMDTFKCFLPKGENYSPNSQVIMRDKRW